MSVPSIPPAVIAVQHEASDPAVSAWVSANAGAGKTHVLAQRVIRLLLENETDPAKILCLTFTKAAAANMANRIFDTLREWIALDDEKLNNAIRETGAKTVGAKQRNRARRLFAAALETPGGLKVQTIHGFCTRLLQQFPFEANVPARFRVLEEIEQKQLLEQLRREVLFEAANDPQGAAGRALATIIPLVTDYAFQDGLNEAINERDRIAAWLADAGSINKAATQLSAALDIRPDDTLESVETAILNGPHLPSGGWMSAAGICASSTSNDQRQAKRLQNAIAATGRTRVEAYLEVFFSTTSGELRSALITKSLAKQCPDLADALDREKARLPGLCEQRRAIIVRNRTMALIAVAVEVIECYRVEKNRRGLLDYDDLIARTHDLLTRIDAAWVHYKLDLGIDHLLIDEAQDTSPEQWDIIKRFVGEFFAGAGARSQIKRSIFAVGDDKQSIFSFQGAEPLEFDAARRYFERVHAAAELEFRAIPSIYSFRSVPLVLEAVDEVFKQPAAHRGLTADPVATIHKAVRTVSPGLVELWPLVEPDDKPEVDPWDQPFDTSSETSPRVKLARQIAAAVKVWLARGDLVGDGEERRPLRAGDILILVRQRGPLFEAIIRALKSADIAVAGADRLLLTEHIAVMDLLVLADAILHPPDDLALATVLKSPLFGFAERELFDLAGNRGKSTLRNALHSVRPDLVDRLDALAAAAQSVGPFAFYADLLGRGGGRNAFLARLGVEANDAIDEFLNLALDYENRQTPSLQGFINWLRTASTEVKRDMEIARDEVRVMTVHGAKGLEAPVVVLADTTTQPAGPVQYQPRLLSLPARDAISDTPDRIVWMPNKRDDTATIATARVAASRANEDEYRRLLYVAMTRAADRLIVCGSIGEKAMPPGCWYELVRTGLEATGLMTEELGDFGGSIVWRYRKYVPEAASGHANIAVKTNAPQLPSWLTTPVRTEPGRARILPSRVLEEHQAQIGGAIARKRARIRGIHVHRLIQSLPDVPVLQRAEAARRHLARQRDLDDAERAEIGEHTLRLMGDLRFDKLFLPGSQAEVSIAGRVTGRAVSGQVDRLVVTQDEVLIADYKTNRPAPLSLAEAETRYPEYVTQLALYRSVLMRLYPGRPVRAALLWTDTPDLMEVPASDLDAALAILTSP